MRKRAHNAAVRFSEQQSKMTAFASNMKSTLKRREVKTELRFAAFTLFEPYAIYTHKNFQQVLVISANTGTE